MPTSPKVLNLLKQIDAAMNPAPKRALTVDEFSAYMQEQADLAAKEATEPAAERAAALKDAMALAKAAFGGETPAETVEIVTFVAKAKDGDEAGKGACPSCGKGYEHKGAGKWECKGCGGGHFPKAEKGADAPPAPPAPPADPAVTKAEAVKRDHATYQWHTGDLTQKPKAAK